MATIAGPYFDFNTLAGAALEITAESRKLTLSSSNKAMIMKVMLSLPRHADVHDELKRLQMFCGIGRKYKPPPLTYQMVAKGLNVTTSDLWMVAAHAWDIIGARQAGCAAAFVAREGKVLNALTDKPDIVGEDLRHVVERITSIEC